DESRSHLYGGRAEFEGRRHSLSVHDSARRHHWDVTLLGEHSYERKRPQEQVLRRIEGATMAARFCPLGDKNLDTCTLEKQRLVEVCCATHGDNACVPQGFNPRRWRHPKVEADHSRLLGENSAQQVIVVEHCLINLLQRLRGLRALFLKLLRKVCEPIRFSFRIRVRRRMAEEV